jgi:tetratricopeptide (TPR) repeat protein
MAMILEIGEEKIKKMKDESRVRWDKGRGYLKRIERTGELISQRNQKYFFDLGEELNEGKTIETQEGVAVTVDKISGFEDIYKEVKKMENPGEVYTDFNFQMGIACREMGFIDEAIEEFKLSMENGQKASESANQLSRCYRDKGWLEEATQAFQKALGIKEGTKTDSLKVMPDLELVEVF